MYQINYQDSEVSHQADPEDTLLSAALRSKISFPYECNSGGCGACKFELIEGEIDEIWSNAPGLSARDRRKGKHLACQCKAKSDLNVKVVNSTDKKATYQPRRFFARVVEKHFLSEEMIMLKMEANQAVNFIPGQYFMLNIPGLGVRAYSASNTVNDNQLSFIIKVVPDGSVSNHLATTKLTELQIDGPYGTSLLQQGEESASVFVSGGSGIAPMLSMVNTLVASNYNKPIMIFYGSRLESELIIATELFASSPKLQLVNVLSNPAQNSCWGGEKGFVHEVLQKYIQDYSTSEFYLCGPPPMITATQKLLMIRNGVKFDNIHFDRFF